MAIKCVTGATILVLGLSGLAHAQTSGAPAELPPATFAGNQYVDSNGCAFVRAGIGGTVEWAPRVDANRQQICNLVPTFAPAVEDTPSDETEAAPAGQTTEVAPVLGTGQGEAESTDEDEMDTAEVASISPQARPVAPAPARRIVRAAAPAPAMQPAPPAVPMTREEVCEDRSGPQPGFVSNITGEIIDCGTAPSNSADATPTMRRLTQEQACNEVAALGKQLRDARTGLLIDCGAGAQSLMTADLLEHRFVQVGSFAVPSNADRLIARLAESGLPVSQGRSRGLRIVAAGPFSARADLDRAMQIVRQMGFLDAYPRN